MPEIKSYFTPEKIQKDQDDDIRLLNMAALEFGNAIIQWIPPCVDQRDCIKKLREIVYVGEAAIRLRGDL